MSLGPTRGATDGSSWKRRPLLAFLLRALVLVAPVAFTFAVMRVVAPTLYHPGGAAGFVIWVAQAAVIGTASLALASHLAQKALPAVALLNMSLVFPDEVPSRFGVALRTGTMKRSRERAAAIGAGGVSGAHDVVELVAALGRHDRLTRGHTERTRAYAELIGEEMGLTPMQLDKLRWAVMLHDIGKLRVPAEVLNKESKLTDAEWESLRQHPAHGEEMVHALAPWLGEWRHAAGHHHERWDGNGYPYGLQGTEISLAGRIVAVADAYDVITTSRSYKEAMSPEAAREELVRCAGGQFDPAVVKAFLNVSVKKVRPVLGPVAWLAELPGLSSVAATSVTTVGTAAAGVSVVVAGAAAVNAEVVDDAPPAAVAFTEELPTAEAPASVAQTSVAHVADVAAPEAVPGTGALESSAVTTTTATPALDSMSSSTTASMPIAPTTSTTVPSTTSTAVATTSIAPLEAGTAADCDDAAAGQLDLAGADLQGCDLRGLDLAGADLTNAILVSADLEGADLAGATLTGADLRSIAGRGADFDEADLRGALLDNADLRETMVRDADLSGASLRWAELRDAKLMGATLAGASLVGADLRDAKLQHADLTNASFEAATSTPTQSAQATFDTTTCPDGSVTSDDCWP